MTTKDQLPPLLTYTLTKTTRRLTFDIVDQAEQVTYCGEDDGPYLKFTASNGYEVISRSRMDIQTERIWLLGAKSGDEQRSGTMIFSSDAKRDAAYTQFILALDEWAVANGGRALQALAQQAQEPVAWRMRDTGFRKPRFVYFDTKDQAEAYAAQIAQSRDDGHLVELTPLYTTPQPQPAPPVPAPVDEREAFEAWMDDDGQGPAPRICSRGSPCEGEYADQCWETAWRVWQAGRATQPAPVVPDDVARDAECLNWIERQHLEELSMGLVIDASHDGQYYVCGDSGTTHYGKTLREAIMGAIAESQPNHA